jgi:hypothetical protein
MRDELREAGLDFAQTTSAIRPRGAWPRPVVPLGVLATAVPTLGDSIPGAMSGDRLIRTSSGILAAVAPVRDGVALVTGVRLNPGYWEQLGQVREARSSTCGSACSWTSSASGCGSRSRRWCW